MTCTRSYGKSITELLIHTTSFKKIWRAGKYTRLTKIQLKLIPIFHSTIPDSRQPTSTVSATNHTDAAWSVEDHHIRILCSSHTIAILCNQLLLCFAGWLSGCKLQSVCKLNTTQ